MINNVSQSMVQEINHYLHRLFPLCRSITGEPNRQTLRILQEIIPLKICEVPSGTEVYDWVVPEEWTVRDAWIADDAGRRIVSFQEHNLHLVSYSTPIRSIMTWAELKPHLHRHPNLPDAIPYRTSYYKKAWGFCVTQAQYEKLSKVQGQLTVVVDTDIKPGSLTYGEYLLPGRSKKEILLSCYICHPSMANDSLSGVLLTTFLARYLASLSNLHWSYRIVFVPETIGAITYCFLNEIAMKAIDIGFVITTVGGPGFFSYKKTWQSDHWLNEIIERVLKETGQEYKVYPFDIHGSDERQYSSQGFRINIASVFRDRYYDYFYYHSSLDNLFFVTAEQINDTLILYRKILEKLEKRLVYKNTTSYCEVKLSRHNLYPMIGGSQLPRIDRKLELDLLLWILFYCDGDLDVDQVSYKIGVTKEKIIPLIKKLIKKNMLKKV